MTTLTVTPDELATLLARPGVTVAPESPWQPATQQGAGRPETPPGRTQGHTADPDGLTSLQASFETLYRQLGGVGEWEANYRFLPGRKLELDYAMPDWRIGVEVNGGQWKKGKSGHSSGRGLHRDAEKQNLAILHGWTIFWLTTDMLSPAAAPVHVGRVVEYVRERMENE